MPIFWRVLIINGCWILSKAFSASIITWFLSFSLLIWCIILIDLHILKNPCIPGINLTWSWCMSFWPILKWAIKTRMSTPVTSIQHSFGSPRYSNQRRKRKKRNLDWKRSKTLSVCRWHDTVHRKTLKIVSENY